MSVPVSGKFVRVGSDYLSRPASPVRLPPHALETISRPPSPSPSVFNVQNSGVLLSSVIEEEIIGLRSHNGKA